MRSYTGAGPGNSGRAEYDWPTILPCPANFIRMVRMEPWDS